MNENKTNINWYPGHMEKTKRQIKELLPLIDFVVELVDARIPYSSKMREIDDLVKNKFHLLVMTKKDLCDVDETKKWIEKYSSKDTSVLLIDSNNESDINNLKKVINDLAVIINDKRKKKGLKSKDIRGLVIGTPNVGKSTLINRIAKKKIAGVANIPGYTKNISWLKCGNVLLLDVPGILWPKLESEEIALNLAAMGTIKQEILPVDDVAVHILKKLHEHYPKILENKYNISNIDDFEDVYTVISKNIGAMKKGEVDYNKVSLKIINDIKNESIKGITFDRCI